MGLGLVGVSSVVLEAFTPSESREGLVLFFMSFACGTWLWWFVRCCARPGAVRVELLSKPAVISNYGAWHMTWLFSCGRIFTLISPEVATAGLYLGALVQFVLMSFFLRACAVQRVAPEPFWNPPTLTAAATTIVGAKLLSGEKAWLNWTSMALGFSVQLLEVPFQVYRVMATDAVAPGAGVSLMQAPCSLNAVAWGVMRRRYPSEELFGGCADPLTHTLFFFSTLVLWLTVLALWRRRACIRTRGFGTPHTQPRLESIGPKTTLFSKWCVCVFFLPRLKNAQREKPRARVSLENLSSMRPIRYA